MGDAHADIASALVAGLGYHDLDQTDEPFAVDGADEMGVASGHLAAALADPLVAGRAVEAATAILRRHRQEMLEDLGPGASER
jgi:hypothetical protein